MLKVYVFSLAVSGGLLVIAALADFLDLDFGDADLDADIDVDVDLDADVETDIQAFKIFSIRGLLYSLFGFGLVGTALSYLWGGQQTVLTGVAAGVSGLASGVLVSSIFSWLKRSESGERADDSSFAGLVGRMSVPIGPGGLGKVRVERGDRVHELVAVPFEGELEAAAHWSRVVVVEVKDGRAQVVPDDEGLLPPGE